jgi:glucan phosphorylase
MGSLLGNSLINLGLYDEVNKLLRNFGYDLESIMKEEPDMDWQRRIGRLARVLWNASTLKYLPLVTDTVGIGIFDQDIGGWQIENGPSLRHGNLKLST